MYVHIRAVSDKEDKKYSWRGKKMNVSSSNFSIAVKVRRIAVTTAVSTKLEKVKRLELSAREPEQRGTGERYGSTITTIRDLNISLTTDDLLRIFHVALSKKLLVVPSLEKLREVAGVANLVCKQFGAPKRKGQRTLTTRSTATRRSGARRQR